MSKEGKRVAIIEDDEYYQNKIRAVLEAGGHTVVAEARTLADAMSLARQLKNKRVQVVTLDGNLSPDQDMGYEGAKIFFEIKQHAPKVKVIGMSGVSQSYVHVKLGKHNIGKLADAVSKL